MNDTPDIQVGILGFGLGTRVFHAPFVSAVPGLRLHSIVQRSGDLAAQLYPQAQILRTPEALFADPAIQLVVVSTPNETHVPLARAALEAGKHVVIDKPFAPTSAGCRELIELAQEMGLLVVPFHNRRWDGDFLTLQALLSSGKLGRLVTFESHFDRFRPIVRENTWKESASPANGLLMDLGPHLVDQVLTLFGTPESVTASIRTDRDNTQIEDAFDIALAYPGLLAFCRSSMLACDASPRFLLHGTHGSFKKYGLDPQEPALVSGASLPALGSSEAWLEEPRELWGTLTLAPDPALPNDLTTTLVPTQPGDYRPFYANVRDAIRGDDALAVQPESAFDTLRVLELARQSSNEKRTLPFA